MSSAISERKVIFLIGAVQFVNILDFMIVMPLGPDFAHGLGIPLSHLGLIGGSYTAAASLSGLAGALFLDRFDRRSALAVAMFGLVLGTAAGGFATGLGSLIAARLLAGVFGGPATSIAFSIIADVIPIERRGKAVGAVMGAFAVASVMGVPVGLELARRGGWRTPFFAVSVLGLAVVAGAIYLLPSMRRHLEGSSDEEPRLRDLMVRPTVLISYSMTAVAMMGGFILIPNISAYVQHNLGYPRARLGLLYAAGGLVSFGATRLVGHLVDRYGSFRIGTSGSALLAVVIFFGFVSYSPSLPVVAIFVMFMLAMAFRNVSYNTLTSKVPSPRERARFMSLQSTVQHAASAVGAFLSSRMLRELPDGRLDGIKRVAWVTIALTLALPPLMWIVERRVLERKRPVPSPAGT